MLADSNEGKGYFLFDFWYSESNVIDFHCRKLHWFWFFVEMLQLFQQRIMDILEWIAMVDSIKWGGMWVLRISPQLQFSGLCKNYWISIAAKVNMGIVCGGCSSAMVLALLVCWMQLWFCQSLKSLHIGMNQGNLRDCWKYYYNWFSNLMKNWRN